MLGVTSKIDIIFGENYQKPYFFFFSFSFINQRLTSRFQKLRRHINITNRSHNHTIYVISIYQNMSQSHNN